MCPGWWILMTVETFKTGRNKRLHSGGNKDWLFASFAALIDECKSSNCRTTLQCVHCHHCSGEVLMVTWCMHTHYLSTLWYNFTTITQNIPGLLCVKRLGADWRADAAITANESCEDAAPDNWTFMELGHKNCRDYWWWWLGTRAQTNLREVWSFTITDKLGPYPSWKQLLALLHLSVESIDRLCQTSVK